MKQDNLVLITGASGGVGLAVVEYLLRTGWKNIVCQYHKKPDKISALLTEYGIDSTRLIQADLTDEAHVSMLHDRIMTNWGPVFGLVNLAGTSSNRMSWKLTRHEFRDVVDGSLMTTFLACREFVPEMREHNRGRIINCSSVVAYTGVVGSSHYCAAKAAVVGFTKSLALETAANGIVVSAIALGFFQFGLIESVSPDRQKETLSRIPVKRFGTAEEVGGLVAYLLSEDATYVGGQVFHMNGGMF